MTYSQRFVSEDVVLMYDRQVYAPESWHSWIWHLEQTQVRPLIRGLVAGRGESLALDFATGTGRVLKLLEDEVPAVVGIDTSPAMLAAARARVPRARLVLGDLLEEPSLIGTGFDIITAFRFFLNVEPGLRRPVLMDLSGRLRDRDSRLIFNVHRNSHGLDGFPARTRAWNEQTMSAGEAKRLAADCGLEVVTWWGFGLAPAAERYLRPAQGVFRKVDRAFAGSSALRPLSRDLVFVCRRRA